MGDNLTTSDCAECGAEFDDNDARWVREAARPLNAGQRRLKKRRNEKLGKWTHDCDPHKFMSYQCEIIDSADRKLILEIRTALEVARRKYKDDMAAAYQVHGDAVRMLQAAYQEMKDGEK